MLQNEFMIWLGTEFEKMSKVPVDDMSTVGSDIVAKAVEALKAADPQVRTEVLDELFLSHETKIIGKYSVPWYERDVNDHIEGITATIEGLLEGWA